MSVPDVLTDCIGFKVFKKSGEPFYSGQMVNTVKDVCVHHIFVDRYAFLFEEDDSCVEVRLCKRLSKFYEPCKNKHGRVL